MNISKKIFDFFIYGNLFVSLCVVALCECSRIILEVSQSDNLPLIFFSTLFIYNFQRYVRINNLKENSNAISWTQKNMALTKLLMICSLIFVFFFATKLSVKLFFCLVPIFIISIFYSLKIFTQNGINFSIRELPLVKIFLISFVWSYVTVILIAVEKDLFINSEIIILFLSRFCFVFAITIPFDIRDLKYDSHNLKTIPQKFGEEKSKNIAFYALATFEIFSIILFFISKFPIYVLISLIFCSLLTAILIYRSSSKKNSLYFSFYVESASILMLLLLFILQLAFGIFVPIN